MNRNEKIQRMVENLSGKINRSEALNLMICNLAEEINQCREEMLYHAMCFYKNLLDLRDGEEHEVDFGGTIEKAKLMHPLEDDGEIAVLMYCMGHLHGRSEHIIKEQEEKDENNAKGDVSS